MNIFFKVYRILLWMGDKKLFYEMVKSINYVEKIDK